MIVSTLFWHSVTSGPKHGVQANHESADHGTNDQGHAASADEAAEDGGETGSLGRHVDHRTA